MDDFFVLISKEPKHVHYMDDFFFVFMVSKEPKHVHYMDDFFFLYVHGS